MVVVLLLAMIGIPIVEIAVFIEVGGRLGLWPTLGAVILTAMVGTALLRQQGMTTLLRARQSLEQHRFPVAEVFDGVCLLVAGALLLTPGFVTDAAGLLLFVPALRAALRQALARRLLASGRVEVWTEGPESSVSGARRDGATVIDGDYHEVSPEDGVPREREDGSGDPRPPRVR